MKTKTYMGAIVYIFTVSLVFSQSATDTNVSGNNEAMENTSQNTSNPRTLYFNAAYFGEFIVHPGVKAGVQLEFSGNGIHRLFGETNLGYFYQPRISNNLFVDVEIAYRLTFLSGIFLQINVGAGYNHVFVDGKTYDYVNGKVITVANSGNSYFMPLASLAIGYDLGFKNATPAPKIYIKPFYFGQYPMNQILVPNIGLEIGVSIPVGLKGN